MCYTSLSLVTCYSSLLLVTFCTSLCTGYWLYKYLPCQSHVMQVSSLLYKSLPDHHMSWKSLLVRHMLYKSLTCQWHISLSLVSHMLYSMLYKSLPCQSHVIQISSSLVTCYTSLFLVSHVLYKSLLLVTCSSSLLLVTFCTGIMYCIVSCTEHRFLAWHRLFKSPVDHILCRFSQASLNNCTFVPHSQHYS